MALCKCGCNKETAAGEFLPGHDQTYRIETARMVGGDVPLRELAVAARRYANGEQKLSDFSDVVRRLFARLHTAD